PAIHRAFRRQSLPCRSKNRCDTERYISHAKFDSENRNSIAKTMCGAPLMSIPDFRDRSPEEIIGCEYLDDSAWHIYTALSWLDYAQRKNAPIALHYSGFHLRYGIEHLWFEIFFAAKGGDVSPEEYAKAVKKATTLYKLIDSQAPHYKKF